MSKAWTGEITVDDAAKQLTEFMNNVLQEK